MSRDRTGTAAGTTVRLRGRGRTEVAAHGVADAEHLVGKEIARIWSGLGWAEPAVDVLGIQRVGAAGRIAEEFGVEYEVRAAVAIAAPTSAEARREVLRLARAAVAGTRYARIEWVSAEVPDP